MTTITFTDKSGKYKCTVKEEFLTKCPNPSDYTMLELNKDFDLYALLHNDNAPAIERNFTRSKNSAIHELIKKGEYYPTEKNNKIYEFWVNGRCVNREDPTLAEQMWNKFLTKRGLN